MHNRKLISCLVILASMSPALARGGGGCLPRGTPILTPDGPVAIERLVPGDGVIGVVEGDLKPATVLACYEVAAEDYRELRTRFGTALATPEHPFMVDRGVFRTAGCLRAGESVYVRQGQSLVATPLLSVRRVQAAVPAYNLMVSPGGTFIAGGMAVHNKGCFLGDTPILRGDGTAAPIADVRPGDVLLAFLADGRIVRTTVRSVLSRRVDEYLVVTTGKIRLVVTPEHPFYVGRGIFKTIESLAVGDQVYAYDGAGLSLQPIVSIDRVAAAAIVYNLQTDQPNTFFANGVAVHNKGGGGCFPAGTGIWTPSGVVPIDRVRPGQVILAVKQDGQLESGVVEDVFSTSSSLLTIRTDLGALRTTAEHPVLVMGGGFRHAGQVRVGQSLGIWRDGRLGYSPVRSIGVSPGQVAVFNLGVSWPHTFIADGFVVHNKGGGGFHGGGYRFSTGGGGGKLDSTAILWIGIIFGGIILIAIVKAIAKSGARTEQNLDYCYSPAAIAPKADKTRRMAEFIARQDPTFNVDALTQTAEATFVRLQECWQARRYAPMKDLLMPDLYALHCKQIQGLVRQHEINVIESLAVKRTDIVNVRYTSKPDNREFTAIITASARDCYIDDRTREFIRGDDKPESFQEFWTFHLQAGRWLLREIEQTRESDVLKEENFFEQFTDANVNQIYGDAAGKSGQAGPWLERDAQVKATKIERMLNFLARTDKLWDRQQMLQRARNVFMSVHAAREANDPAAARDNDLFPDIAKSLRAEIAGRAAQGVTVEFRNLCIRKVELILVRNYSDNSRDEFTARISAHAQQVVESGGHETAADPHVVPFEEYWTFGRLDKTWKLKEVVPKAQGDQELNAENLDEDSTPAQVQWYYRQTRAN